VLTPAATEVTMHRALATMTIAILATTGCTTTQERVQNRVDPVSITDNERYQSDLAECTRLADQAQNETYRDAGTRSVVGGVLGAATGAAIGAAVGGGSGAATGAAVGGATGVVGGAVTTRGHRDEVIRNCLQNRGYKTLY
jgi:uncharacterized protein YcfJ